MPAGGGEEAAYLTGSDGEDRVRATYAPGAVVFERRSAEPRTQPTLRTEPWRT